MSDIPLRTRLYTIALVLVTVGACAAAFFGFDQPRKPRDLVAVGSLFAMVLLAERLDVTFPRSVMSFHVSVSAAFAFAAGLTVGPFLGGLIAAAAHLLDGVFARRQAIKTVVNASVHGLSTVTSAVVYLALAQGGVAYLALRADGQSPVSTYWNLAAVVLAAATFTIVNSGALALIVSPVVGVNPLEMWRANLRGTYVEMITLTTLGSLIPILVRENPLSVVLLIVPLLVGPRLAFKGLQKTQEETRITMEGLADALERRDPYTHQHSIRVADYVRAVLAEMPHVPRQAVDAIIAAARVHDLGKVGSADTSLKKPGGLTVDERREIEQHATVGAAIIVHLEVYAPGVDSVRHHHERWDGTGYPNGLRGEEIPLGARIIAVADAYDAMTSDRVYRRALAPNVALAELRKGSGSHFDPEIVELFDRAVGRQDPTSGRQPENAPISPERLPRSRACADAGQSSV